jgi:tetratricopeptide (TPR) repeat protein
VLLLGRDMVFGSCAAALESALAGRGRVVLLAGEAGIGKTSLAAAVTEAAAGAGAVTRWAGCWDGGAVPLAPWFDVLRQPGGDACAELAGRLPEGGGGPDLDPAASEHARLRLFAEVIDALRTAAADRPQVVVIDDLHWADGTSLVLLRALAASVSTMRLLVVGTYRDDEIGPDSPLRSLGGASECIGLEGLQPVDVGRLLADVLERAPTDEEALTVHHHTGGNPLFVTHVARILAAGAPLGLPSGVRDVLVRRLARLPAECHEVLGAAAVLGPQFDPAAVAEVVGGQVDGILAALDAAAVARIAVPVDGRPDRWGFTHALVQATRYDSLGSSERASLHRRAGEVLERAGRTPPSVLLHHAVRSRPDPDDPRPASLALAAAQEARARLAIGEAVRLFDQARSLVPVGAGSDPLRAEAWLGLGDARLRLGDEAGSAEAFLAVAGLARSRHDPELLARAALGFGAGLGSFEVRMLDQRQTELLEAAASSLDDSSPLRPWVLARLSVALSFLGSETRRLELADQALAAARDAHDLRAVGAALAARCDAVAGPAFVAERLGAASEIVAIGVQLGDRPLELLGRRLRVAALAELCDMDGLNDEVAAFERSAAVLGDPLYSWYGPLWRGMRAAVSGRMVEAEQLAVEARAIGAQAGSGNAQVLTSVLQLFIALETGDRDRLRARAREIDAFSDELLLENSDPIRVYTDQLAGAPGWRDRAARMLRRIDQRPVDAEWLATLAPLTELAAALEVDEAAAAALYDRFAAFSGLGCVEGIAAMHRGPSDRYLMVLAAMAGQEADALDHLDRALALAGRVGPLLLANTQRAGAQVLRRLREGNQGARADQLEAEAAATFRRMGLAGRAAAAGPGAPGAPGAPAPANRASLIREGDAWAVSWEGRTVRVRHAKGLADLAVLLSRSGREVHVRELEGATAAATSVTRHDVLDPAAVAAYRKRLEDLEDDLDEATLHGDTARAAMLAAERDRLVEELTAAFGLGGRARQAGPDPEERMRKAVSARIKASMDRLEALDGPLGRHLRNSVRTGLWCSYQPERPVMWTVEPGAG